MHFNSLMHSQKTNLITRLRLRFQVLLSHKYPVYLKTNELCCLSNLTFSKHFKINSNKFWVLRKERGWGCTQGWNFCTSLLRSQLHPQLHKRTRRENHTQSFFLFHFIRIQKLISLTSFLLSFLCSSTLALKAQEHFLGSSNCFLPLLHPQCAFVWGPFLSCEKQNSHGYLAQTGMSRICIRTQSRKAKWMCFCKCTFLWLLLRLENNNKVLLEYLVFS